MEGKRKRKASLLSLELGVAKTGFICEQSTDADSYNAEEDGVRGGRMKPLASLEVNRHLPLVDSLQGGLANSSITKKTVSPSAVTAAAKITARAREKARICLLDDKENASCEAATGFRPFRGTKRKGTPEGSGTKPFREATPDSSKSNLNVRDPAFQAQANDNSKAPDAYTGRALPQYSCKSNSVWNQPAKVRMVSVQQSQSQYLGGGKFIDIDAYCSDSLLQSSQDSSKPVPLATRGRLVEPAYLSVACGEVEQTLEVTREGFMDTTQYSTPLRQTDGQAGTTTYRPVALPLTREPHPIRMESSSEGQHSHHLSSDGMEQCSSQSDPKLEDLETGRRHGGVHGTDHPTYQDPKVSWEHRLLRTHTVVHDAMMSALLTPKLRLQHVVPKPETSVPPTTTEQINANMATHRSNVSGSLPLTQTGRRPRVFMVRPDLQDGFDSKQPCLQNLDCEALSRLQGDLKEDRKEVSEGASSREPNGPLLCHQNRLGPKYLPLPPRQRPNNRTKKTGYSKFRPTPLNGGKNFRMDNTRPGEVTEPVGLLGEFNPGIISRIRNCKQVHAILGAVVGSQALEATASVRMHQKKLEGLSQAETAHSHSVQKPSAEGDAVADWSKRSRDVQLTALADRIADGGKTSALGVAAPRQLAGCSCEGAARDLPEIGECKPKNDDKRMNQDPNSSDLATHSFQMDPKTCGAVATVACRWLELLGMDIKGRIAALKRSRRRFRSAVGSGELDIELGPYAVSNTEPGANSRPSQHGQKSDQWKTLFMNMDGMLSVEGGKLERSLKQVTEMQVSCRQAMEGARDPSTSELSPAERKEREMMLAASAASIFSAANFASMLCN